MIRGTLLLALLAAVPRFLGPPLKNPDAGAPDAGTAPAPPLRPGDAAPPFGAPVEKDASLILVVFGDVEAEIVELYTKYKTQGLQAVAVGAAGAPFQVVTDEDRVIARGYRGAKEEDAPRFFLLGRDGTVRFSTSNPGALGRELALALRR